ncbi:MAG TPA: hypothetical protein VF799_00525 [Geobacteraceae bacterium]
MKDTMQLITSLIGVIATIFSIFFAVIDHLPAKWVEKTIFEKAQVKAAEIVAPTRFVIVPAEHVRILEQAASSSKSAEPSVPAQKDAFDVSLISATRNMNKISTNISIKNVASEPLFLAISNEIRPSLTDNIFGLSVNQIFDLTGIHTAHPNQGGIEREERTYTKILPGQTINAGIAFAPYPHGTPENESQINLTIEFLNLHNGKLDKVTKSVSGPMKFL